MSEHTGQVQCLNCKFWVPVSQFAFHKCSMLPEPDPRDVIECPQCHKPHSWNWTHDTWNGTNEVVFTQGELQVTVCQCHCGGTVGVHVVDAFGGDAYVLWATSSES